MQKRTAASKRVTKETQIDLRLTIDGTGKADVQTGAGFFDHMLTLFARHAVVDLKLRCKGDLEVDAHHTVEDCGIALGQAFLEALGEKKGIRRYGMSLLPMDECLARCVIDFGGRPYLVWRGMDELASGGGACVAHPYSFTEDACFMLVRSGACRRGYKL